MNARMNLKSQIVTSSSGQLAGVSTMTAHLTSQIVMSIWMKGLAMDELALREDVALAASSELNIKNLIHVIRGEQVILDSDLAMLYEVETKQLNRNASRNAQRFPEDFRFQLSRDEYEVLKCQIGTSKTGDARGGKRKLPYVYTEQGIAMLSGLLRSEVAINTSVAIMRAFVEMRRFLASNAQLFEQLREMDVRQRLDQERNERRFERGEGRLDELFGLLEAHEEPSQYIFFDGQMYDALEFLTDLVGKAEREIVLVDGYVDLGTLNILKKKRDGVAVTVWAKERGDKLSEADVETFELQYGPVELKHTEAFHDRFLILDGTTGYHIGASIKDAGKKCFGINRLEDSASVESVLMRLEA